MEKNDAIKFLEDYGSMILEAKTKVIKGSDLKTLNPKQMPQRLPKLLLVKKMVIQLVVY